MRKIIFIIAIILISISITLTIYMIVKNNKISVQNKKVLEQIKEMEIEESKFDNELNYYTKLEIYNKDYVGILSIPSCNIILPIEADYERKIQSLCMVKNKPTIILGNNLSCSLKNYKEIQCDDEINIENFLGNSNIYKVKKIVHVSKYEKVEDYSDDLILVVKNYYNMEYVIYLCDIFSHSYQ